MIPGSAWISSLGVCLCFLLIDLTPEQNRGKQIFLNGISARGNEITARLGSDSAPVPAAVLPCASCHGRDGHGRPEGGIAPSDITWDVLTKPYTVTNASGRQRSPYTEPLLKRAIIIGVDSSGNPLQGAMPRFQLKPSDMNDLIAYLQVLGLETDPGITGSEVYLGVVLAPGPRLAESRAAVRLVLEAWQRDVNNKGGIFGRNLELRFLEPPEDSAARIAALREFVTREPVFALLASTIAGVDREMAAFVAEQELPVVGAFGLYPQTASPGNRYLFYLQPGIAEQGRALIIFANRRLGRAPRYTAIVEAADPLSTAAVEAVKTYCAGVGWGPMQEIQAGDVLTGKWQPAGTDEVLILAPNTLAKLLESDNHSIQKTQYLVPAALLNIDLSTLSEELRSRIFISYPALPSDGNVEGRVFYRKLMAGSSNAGHRLPIQWAALTSARLLDFAMENCGRGLNRENLIEALEGVYRYSSGLAPDVSFSPNRRIGSTGSHVAAANHLDQAEWIDPEL
jgi:Periplasmic binding protein/Cytochrome c